MSVCVSGLCVDLLVIHRGMRGKRKRSQPSNIQPIGATWSAKKARVWRKFNKNCFSFLCHVFDFEELKDEIRSFLRAILFLEMCSYSG